MQNKVILGLTGTFGTGKSTVANFFQELGACVSDADKIARLAIQEDPEIYKAVAKLFPEACSKGGEIDRRKIAAVAFSDPEKRKKLEALIHPFVLEAMSEEIMDAS